MSSDITTNRWPRLWVALLWGATGFCAVAWFLQWRSLGQSSTLAPAAALELAIAPDAGAIAKALGGSLAPPPVAKAPEAPPQAARFQLKGVVMAGVNSVALLAVDGQAAKPVVLGNEAVSGWILKSVNPKGASLGPSDSAGAAAVNLELPPR